MDDLELARRALLDTPLIVSTDIGGDPDDMLALILLTLLEPRLELVITSDEFADFRRAELARHLLKLLGRNDVRVVPGQVLGHSRYRAADGLAPSGIGIGAADLYQAVAAVCWNPHRTPVRYLGIGPMTDLAHLLTTDATQRNPLHLNQILRVWQMGGALNYRDPRRAEHNFRLDPPAVHEVMARARYVSLVMSDHTFTTAIDIDAHSPIYRLLVASEADKPWAGLVRLHLDQWFSEFYPASKMHDPLAMTAAIGMDCVSFERRQFHLAPDSRMSPGTDHVAWLSTGADYGRFVNWVLTTLRDRIPARPPMWTNTLGTLAEMVAGLRQLAETRSAAGTQPVHPHYTQFKAVEAQRDRAAPWRRIKDM
ncbi:nucleoside hydrolase [Nocardia sp. BMG51109]|uniref:nucleoside hydrolase n=1 Tax=Nocardia sp. BMG51109 TaxID=1056816 RepID=UPI00046537F7|nr:nucleoside hydrolase [Nocardia sp. BMG51109]